MLKADDWRAVALMAVCLPLPARALPVLQDVSGGGHPVQADSSQQTEPAQTAAALHKGVTPPKLIHPVDPKFPRSERKEGFSGVTEVVLTVATDGSAQGVSVARSCGSATLDGNALDAVRQYRFKPALQAGVPVAVTLTVEVHFSTY